MEAGLRRTDPALSAAQGRRSAGARPPAGADGGRSRIGGRGRAWPKPPSRPRSATTGASSPPSSAWPPFTRSVSRRGQSPCSRTRSEPPPRTPTWPSIALERAYAAIGEPERFTSMCERLIRQDPRDWRARLALARHLRAQGRPDEAAGLLKRAFESNPHSVLVHLEMLRTLRALGEVGPSAARYLDSAEGAVFYADPHVCTACHYRADGMLWRCPHCHEWEHLRGGAGGPDGGRRLRATRGPRVRSHRGVLCRRARPLRSSSDRGAVKLGPESRHRRPGRRGPRPAPPAPGPPRPRLPPHRAGGPRPREARDRAPRAARPPQRSASARSRATRAPRSGGTCPSTATSPWTRATSTAAANREGSRSTTHAREWAAAARRSGSGPRRASS